MAALLIWQLRDIVALILVSLVITAAMRGPIASLVARGIRQSIAIAIAYVVGLAVVVGLFFILGYPLTGEFTQLGNSLMTTYTRLENGTNVFGLGRLDAFLSQRLPTVDQLTAFLTGDQMPVVGQAVFDFTQSISTIIGQFLLAMVLSIYWTADEMRFERFWLSLLPSNQRAPAREIWHTLETQVGAYVRSEVMQGIMAGFLLAPGFWLLEVPYPVIWSLLIALGWFVPLVGGIIFLIPLWLITWSATNAVIASAAVLYTMAVLALMEFFVERRIYTHTRYTSVLMIVIMLMLVDAYGVVGLLIAPLVSIAIEILFAKLAEANIKPALNPTDIPAADLIADQEVAVLQARLEEIRPFLSNSDSPSNLRLANIAERLENLLKEAETL
jgi:predicted PurR-regulated permease PerM